VPLLQLYYLLFGLVESSQEQLLNEVSSLFANDYHKIQDNADYDMNVA
jgi:hypothetical protein